MIITLGADPEFFFRDRTTGDIVGSEKIIPRETEVETDGTLIRDGVAAEINPDSAQCREVLWAEICSIMLCASEYADDKNAKISFDTTVTLTEAEFDSLSPVSKQFGCVPSSNAYGVQPIPEGASSLRQRSAGGHIHIGYKGILDTQNMVAEQTDINKIVKVLDIVAGNTCVMFDQFYGSDLRRINYGRAGEYREKSYGLEYRTLSNFWLRDYKLFALATGLCRQAMWIVGYGHADELLSMVDQNAITEAINENNATLARRNFDKYGKFIAEKHSDWNYPLDMQHFGQFLLLIGCVDPGEALIESTDVDEIYNDCFRGLGIENYLQESY